jgi:hypothetical protein
MTWPAEDLEVGGVVGGASVFEGNDVVDVEVLVAAAVLASAADADECAPARVLPPFRAIELPPRFCGEASACFGAGHVSL